MIIEKDSIRIYVARGVRNKEDYIRSIIHRSQKVTEKDLALVIKYTVFGNPILVLRNMKEYNISISHSRDIVAAVISDITVPIGIDIEVQRENDEKILLFCNTREKLLLENCKTDFLVIWCAKESISKLLRLGIFNVKYGIFEILNIKSIQPNLYLVEYVNFKTIYSLVKIKEKLIIALSFVNKENCCKIISRIIGEVVIDNY